MFYRPYMRAAVRQAACISAVCLPRTADKRNCPDILRPTNRLVHAVSFAAFKSVYQLKAIIQPQFVYCGADELSMNDKVDKPNISANTTCTTKLQSMGLGMIVPQAEQVKETPLAMVPPTASDSNVNFDDNPSILQQLHNLQAQVALVHNL